MPKVVNISDFVGKTFNKISGMEPESEEVLFESDAYIFRMYHDQSCCESVTLNDICGNPADLIGTPILEAYQEGSSEAEAKDPIYHESFTWTFYRVSTIKGTVTLRWYGTSNGCYSEEVDIYRIERK